MIHNLTKFKFLKLIIIIIIIALLFIITFFTPQKTLIINFVIWVQEAGTLGQFIFALIYTVSTVTVMPGMPLALAAGFIYGWAQALLVVVPASIAGGMISFLVGRHLSHGKANKFIKKIPNFNAINKAIKKNGFFLVFILFAYPFTPFRMLNYALSITNLTFKSFTLALGLSMVPHLIPYVYLGSLLSSYEELLNGTFYKLIIKNSTAYIIGIFSTILFLLILFLMIKKIIKTNSNINNLKN